MNIQTNIQSIKPGHWFRDGRGNRFMKVQDILPSGLPTALLTCNPKAGKLTSTFVVNAVSEKGNAACCPPDVKMFFVDSIEDLRPDDYGLYDDLGSNVRHFEQS